MIKQDAGMSDASRWSGKTKQKSASEPYPAANTASNTTSNTASKTTSNTETNTLTTNSPNSKIEDRHRWYQSDDE